MKRFLLVLMIPLLSFCSRNLYVPKQYDTADRVLIVHYLKESDAEAALLVKSGKKWKQDFKCPAFVGKNGIGKTREGDIKTPIGGYRVTGAFGIKPNPGTPISYTEVTSSTFACDEQGPYYNTIIDTAAVHHQCKGEDMHKYVPEYNYGLTINYNPECIYPKGSAVFIHCIGSKRYTGGCIAIPAKKMRRLLIKSTQNTYVYIY